MRIWEGYSHLANVLCLRGLTVRMIGDEWTFLAAFVIYSHNKYAYIYIYMFIQHHNDTIIRMHDKDARRRKTQEGRRRKEPAGRKTQERRTQDGRRRKEDVGRKTQKRKTQEGRRRKEGRRKEDAGKKDAGRKTQEDFFNNILHLTLLQGFERVVQGLHVRGCWRPNINFIFWPPLRMTVTCLSCFLDAQPEA